MIKPVNGIQAFPLTEPSLPTNHESFAIKKNTFYNM